MPEFLREAFRDAAAERGDKLKGLTSGSSEAPSEVRETFEVLRDCILDGCSDKTNGLNDLSRDPHAETRPDAARSERDTLREAFFERGEMPLMGLSEQPSE